MNLRRPSSLKDMLENLQSVTLLSLMEIVDPVLLGAALWLRNRADAPPESVAARSG
jgi:hypothetical protein